jgi:hypothetical protein
MAREVLSEPPEVVEEGVDKGREVDTVVGLVSECCLAAVSRARSVCCETGGPTGGSSGGSIGEPCGVSDLPGTA